MEDSCLLYLYKNHTQCERGSYPQFFFLNTGHVQYMKYTNKVKHTEPASIEGIKALVRLLAGKERKWKKEAISGERCTDNYRRARQLVPSKRHSPTGGPTKATRPVEGAVAGVGKHFSGAGGSAGIATICALAGKMVSLFYVTGQLPVSERGNFVHGTRKRLC